MTFFSDAQVIVNCIHMKSTVANIDPIIQDRKMLLDDLPNSSVHHVRRDMNCNALSLVALPNRLDCNDWLVPPLVEYLCNTVVMPFGNFPR